ncbi:hypothetical protein E2C01_006379 [Portunus trituberculatus]|uniref:Uncharacterized protein n=1 Tax=Portunus trituberculatus TaxID=210409 RepID=A0A5B7CWQ9_PORTR|nr:hypothetical protein [Portunus trituberculatus]
MVAVWVVYADNAGAQTLTFPTRLANEIQRSEGPKVQVHLPAKHHPGWSVACGFLLARPVRHQRERETLIPVLLIRTAVLGLLFWVDSFQMRSECPLPSIPQSFSVSVVLGQPGFLPLGIPVSLPKADLAGWGGACNPFP